jgi:ketosteroid isomerase-like protein
MQKLVTLFIFICLLAPANAQKGRLPCSNPVYRQFDFWIGEWEAFGLNGKKAGDSRISLILDSCIIYEEWTSASLQQGLRYAGKSFNTYNAATKQWQQTWVDNVGGTNEYMLGKFENNQIIYTSTAFKFSKDTMAIRKMTFTSLNADKLRQHGEITKDNGQTWSTEYDLEYRRKQISTDAIVDSILRNMEAAYNKGAFKRIAGFYSKNGKIVNKVVEASGSEQLQNYWNGFAGMAGTWKLENEKTEKIGDMIWQKGISTIADKNGKEHKVNFTLLFILEEGSWKILQDAYW